MINWIKKMNTALINLLFILGTLIQEVYQLLEGAGLAPQSVNQIRIFGVIILLFYNYLKNSKK